MKLITETELAKMEELLARLLEKAGEAESLSLLQLHTQLLAIFEQQSQLRKSQERLKNIFSL